MSVALDLSQCVFEHADQPRAPMRHLVLGGGRTAKVIQLYRPSPQSIATPLRLTRRGILAVTVVVMVIAATLAIISWHGTPSEGATRSIPTIVTVQPGDTLWSLASQLTPTQDPRAEVATLQRLNQLRDVDLAIGQKLRTH